METETPPEFGAGNVRINTDGSVRKKPGPKPGSRNRPRTPTTARAPGARTDPAPRKAPDRDYRPALLGLAQLPQLVLGIAARMVKDDRARRALQLDAVTVGLHAPNVAEAVNTTAQHDKKLAQVCERLATVGPYSLVIAAITVPIAQCLANHGVIPPNEAMGVLPEDQLIKLAEATG